MQGFFSVIVLSLFSALVAAQEGDLHPPSETVSMIYVVLFCLLFVGMIAGFFVYLWINERKKKQDAQ